MGYDVSAAMRELCYLESASLYVWGLVWPLDYLHMILKCRSEVTITGVLRPVVGLHRELVHTLADMKTQIIGLQSPLSHPESPLASFSRAIDVGGAAYFSVGEGCGRHVLSMLKV